MAAAERPHTAPDWDHAAKAMVRAAQAVARIGSADPFADLVRELAAIVGTAAAFVATFGDDSRRTLRTLGVMLDGRPLPNFDYELEGTPCAQVVGREFRFVERGVAAEFPPGALFAAQGMDSYAAFPLADSEGTPLGLLAVMDRQPIADAALAEALLKIFAGRIVAEIERTRVDAALRRSEASYRTIFEAAEDAIFVFDWDSGAIVDVNPKTCASYGYTADEMKRLTIVELSSGEPPYDVAHARQHFQLARLGQCPPFEWHRRNRDGSLHWDEVRMKPAHIDGRPHVLAFTREVTAHKAALAALQASEQRYRGIFDGSADSMGLWNADLRLVDVNRAFTRLSGWRRDDIIGRRLDEREHEPDTAQRSALIRDALAGREGRIEARVPGKQGQRHDVEVRYVPVSFGGESYALSIARDITERNAALEALRAQEQKYRAIFDGTVDSMVLWNRELRVVDVNDAFLQMTGMTRDQVVGHHWRERPDAEDLPQLLALIERALAGDIGQETVNVARADGSRFDIELRCLPVRLGDEAFALGVGRDVSGRLENERRLRDSEAQYRAIFNASADALILWNSRYQRVDVNPAYERIYGWMRDEVVGRGYDHPQYDEAYARPRRELVRRALGGEACSAELEALRKDGQHIQTEVHAMPFVHRGEPHVLAIARDITERRAAEAERARLEAQLRQAQKMEAIGQLTGGIAHDFNNILTSVIGYLVLAEERAGALGDERIARHVGRAQLAAQRARELIAQMLAFARRQRGERHVLALAPLVKQTLQLLRSTLPSSVSVDAALPDDGDLRVDADPVQLEQVLFNLCINARDAIDGTGRIRVRLEESGAGFVCASCRLPVSAGRRVALSVADDGCGIDAATLERIFEPFFSTKEVGRGTGMGLAMVHGIVHDHRGHIDVQSRPGRGSTFRVLLPPASGSAGAAADAATSRAGAAPAPLAGSVMVVDDEPMVGDVMAELLESWGLQVRLERSPQAALDRLADAGYAVDLLITDQTMPGLTGIQLAQQAVALRPGLPVLLYTGNTTVIDAAALPAHGIRALLAKPVDAEALRTWVQRLLIEDAAPV